MATPNFTVDSVSSRITRPLVTSNGFGTDVDPTAKSHLDELNEVLARRNPSFEERNDYGPRDLNRADVKGNVDAKKASDLLKRADDGREAPAANAPLEKGRRGHGVGAPPRVSPAVIHLLERPLTPKRMPREWADDSLAAAFQKGGGQGGVTLADFIDGTPELSSLKYKFQSRLASMRSGLDYNARTILENYPAITDYLIAYAYLIQERQDVSGLINFVLKHKNGVKNVANYVVVSAARAMIDDKQLVVNGHNQDDGVMATMLKNAALSLSSQSFAGSVLAKIDVFRFDSDELKIINDAQIGEIPESIKPLLVKYLKSSPIKITKENVKHFLPLFISQASASSVLVDTPEVDAEQSAQDFEVEFFKDDDARIEVSKFAVRCAAQLYYSMILGDELTVFNIVNHFTHKYLVRGAVEIQDSRLREDLQNYVFSNRFTDLKTGRLADRTRPAERLMFYKQVFNYGNAQITDDVVVNAEFPRLWKVLILESAKFLERARAAFNPTSLVSKNNVMQAVEDLQYNLSTHCTGMANVITPLIYAELNFVIQRIFMHKEILRQVVPSGGTWWKVVENVYMDMRNARPKATVLYNKAKIGHDILRSIADYNPTAFEADDAFFRFMSNVDAFITTQSILQEALTDDLKKTDDYDEDAAPAGQNGNGNGNGTMPKYGMEPQGAGSSDAVAPANGAAEAGPGEWDF